MLPDIPSGHCGVAPTVMLSASACRRQERLRLLRTLGPERPQSLLQEVPPGAIPARANDNYHREEQKDSQAAREERCEEGDDEEHDEEVHVGNDDRTDTSMPSGIVLLFRRHVAYHERDAPASLLGIPYGDDVTFPAGVAEVRQVHFCLIPVSVQETDVAEEVGRRVVSTSGLCLRDPRVSLRHRIATEHVAREVNDLPGVILS